MYLFGTLISVSEDTMPELAVPAKTIVLKTADEPGVLERIAGVFRRRGWNMKSVAIGRSEEPGVARGTILATAATAGNGDTTLIVQQIRKLIPVFRAEDITSQPLIAHELALVKIKHDSLPEIVDKVTRIALVLKKATITIEDEGPTRLIVQVVGTSEIVDQFCDLVGRDSIEVLKTTGTIAMIKGEAVGEFREERENLTA